jgi:hypothetical protein
MTLRRPLLAALLALASTSGARSAQGDPPPAAPPEAPPEWSFSAAAYGYFVPEEEFIAVPMVTADRGGLHLEGRYNYEERGAGSLFAGWTFSLGDEVALDLTPLLGGVFGDLSGIAPGLELDLSWKRFSFYFEGEYVHDLHDDEGSFLYGWSELSYTPADWVRVGLVGQRTRLYDTGLDIQRGLLLGLSYGSVEVAGYFFNPGSDDHFEVVSLSVEF